MKYIAHQKFIRTSPRKLRIIAESLRPLTPQQAVKHLAFINNRGSLHLKKVITQAIANATNNHQADPTTLRFEHIEINEGPTYKRWRAVSRGRAHSIFKRTSHIKVTLKSTAPTVQPTATKEASKPKTKKEAKKSTKPAKKASTKKTTKSTKKSK